MPASHEGELLVRRDLAQPVERAAVDERESRALGEAHVDHEPQPVVVAVVEVDERRGDAWNRRADPLGQVAMLRGRRAASVAGTGTCIRCARGDQARRDECGCAR